MSTNKKFAHELVAQTAKAMAAEFYDIAAEENDFFKHYPKQHLFVNREWKRFVEVARQQLSLMLGQPQVPEWQKEQIMDALIKHASLPGNMNRQVARKLINAEDITGMEKVH